MRPDVFQSSASRQRRYSGVAHPRRHRRDRALREDRGGHKWRSCSSPCSSPRCSARQWLRVVRPRPW